MIGASNIRQQARFWRAVERSDMIKTDNEARVDDREREAAIIADIIKTKTADEWEVYFQARHVPAARVRTMAEALADHILPSAACSTNSTRSPASTVRSRCLSRRSNLRMADPRSSTRRTRWAPIPRRYSPSMATAPRRSPAFAARG